MSKNDWLFLGALVIVVGVVAKVVQSVDPKCKWCGAAITVAQVVSDACPACNPLRVL
jgi:hypothetical protein